MNLSEHTVIVCHYLTELFMIFEAY